LAEATKEGSRALLVAHRTSLQEVAELIMAAASPSWPVTSPTEQTGAPEGVVNAP
jgi:hypothetical protein